MKTFGLVGYPLGHSFSKIFFSEKFKNEGLSDHQYVNFEIENISKFTGIFDLYDNICGLNCTIPYKQQIIPFLDAIDDEAKMVGAINTIKISNTPKGIHLKGFNTDVIGFEEALKPMLNDTHKRALVLGTGGASKAVKFVLSKLGIEYISATTKNRLTENELNYNSIDERLISGHTIIINATPLGTYPNIETCANIPYKAITKQHLLFDLVYNPTETLFMRNGREKGAKTKNGLEMLHKQAEAAWKIWNS